MTDAGLHALWWSGWAPHAQKVRTRDYQSLPPRTVRWEDPDVIKHGAPWVKYRARGPGISGVIAVHRSNIAVLGEGAAVKVALWGEFVEREDVWLDRLLARGKLKRHDLRERFLKLVTYELLTS